MAAYPALARIPLSTSEKVLTTGSNTLYKFSVQAVDGDISLYKFSFIVGSSTVSATTSSYALYSFTESGFNTADTTFSSDGLVNANSYEEGLVTGSDATAVRLYPDKGSATTTYTIGNGSTRWFELRATASSLRTSSGSESFTVSLSGDAAFPTGNSTLMESAANAASDTNGDFIWSPVSNTSV